MRLLLLALLLTACASPDSAPDPAGGSSRLGAPADVPEAGAPEEEAPADTLDGFDAQAWLAEAREVGVGVYGADLDDPGTVRMKELAGELDAVAGWRRACDTYRDYETGEEVYDPVAPGEGSWARGTFEVAEISDGQSLVAVTCDFGAYQGGYAFVRITGNDVELLTAPLLDEGGQPSGPTYGIFGTPDLTEASAGILRTFAKARGLGDCGVYVEYAMGEGDSLSVQEVRQRECGDDIPDPFPAPSDWPVVYRAE